MASKSLQSQTPMSFIQDRTRNRLHVLRVLSIAAMISLIVGVPALLAIPLPAAPLMLIVTVLGAAAALAAKPGRSALPIGPLEAWAHLSLDLAAWSAFLYFTGGATNPVISILLPLVAIGAAVLPPLHAWILAGSAVLAYTTLWEHHYPLDVYDSDLAINWHLTGMWLTFSVSAALITFYILRMTATIRAKDLALARERERALRDERIVALGSLAASAAHELGTPLGTLAVLIGEQLHDDAHSVETREDLELMRSQVANCKTILTRLTHQAGLPRASDGNRDSIAGWLKSMATRWQMLRPEASLQLSIEGTLETTVAVFDPNVEPALLNLVNNAADASPNKPIRIAACMSSPGMLEIRISDDGAGFDDTSAQAANSSGSGLGIGLVLSRASIERAQGQLEFAGGEMGGTVATVRLPIPSHA